MNGFDDMPPLVDSDAAENSYPSSSYIPPPSGASFSNQWPGTSNQYPPWNAGGSSLWAGATWGGTPGATQSDYPSFNNAQYTSTPLWSSPQNQGWGQMASQTPLRWGFHTTPSSPNGNWPTPSSFGANLPASGMYSPYSSYTTPQFGQGSSSYNTPLMRSSSISSPYSVKRSSSAGPSDPFALARRPRDWRQGFKIRTGIAAILPRRQRSLSSSSVREFYDDTKRVLHNFLQYNSFSPPVTLDLRDDPMSTKFHLLNRPFNHYDLLQYACEPPVNFMRLYHDKLPWYIDIHARHPSGVTIHDLFDQMHDGLMVQIHNEHYYNEEMDDDDRAKLAQAFKERCGDDQNEFSKGVRRVDFLRGHVLFEGLVRGRNGMWEMKTKKLRVGAYP